MSSARSLRRRTARRVAATRSAPESSRARHAAPGVDARDRTRGRRTTGTRQARQGSRRSRSAARRGDRRARHADRRGRAAGHSGHRDQRRSARQRTPNYGETRRGPRDGTAVGATDPRGPRPLPADHHPSRHPSRQPQIPATPNPGGANVHLTLPEATVRATHSADPKSRCHKRPPRTPRAHRSRHPFRRPQIPVAQTTTSHAPSPPFAPPIPTSWRRSSRHGRGRQASRSSAARRSAGEACIG